MPPKTELTERDKQLVSTARNNLASLLPPSMPRTVLEKEIQDIVAAIEKLLGY